MGSWVTDPCISRELRVDRNRHPTPAGRCGGNCCRWCAAVIRIRGSADHLIRLEEEGWGHGEAQCLGGLE
jgi:hypothetical protein